MEINKMYIFIGIVGWSQTKLYWKEIDYLIFRCRKTLKQEFVCNGMRVADCIQQP